MFDLQKSFNKTTTLIFAFRFTLVKKTVHLIHYKRILFCELSFCIKNDYRWHNSLLKMAKTIQKGMTFIYHNH
jgi:thermostable 8-oxoguanine DNA glycosylase